MKLTEEELDQILSTAGLRMNQAYSSKGSYRKDEYIFTQCINCGTEAHYRLKYILHKNEISEKTCRAFYWRAWYGSSHELYDSSVQNLISWGMSRRQLIEEGIIMQEKDLRWSEAQNLADANGYELIDLLHGDRAGDDVMITRCPNCGRQEPKRPEDVAFRCPCGGVKAKGGIAYSETSNEVTREEKPHDSKQYQTGEDRALIGSGLRCLGWWDAQLNKGPIPPNLTKLSRKAFWWRCPDCGAAFSAPVFMMSRNPHCPACSQVAALRFDIEWDELSNKTISDYPELLGAWIDERDPFYVPITYIYGCKFECPEGHHPNQTPYSYLTRGCMVCRGLQTKNSPDQIFLRESNPELSAEWVEAEDGERYTPDTVKSGSKRSVVWQCIACGETWSDTVREREKREKNRCPHCGKVMGSLAWKYPSLAKEWHPDNPISPWNTKPFGKLDFKPMWICSDDPTHVWSATTASRINHGKNCPICEKKHE